MHRHAPASPPSVPALALPAAAQALDTVEQLDEENIACREQQTIPCTQLVVGDKLHLLSPSKACGQYAYTLRAAPCGDAPDGGEPACSARALADAGAGGRQHARAEPAGRVAAVKRTRDTASNEAHASETQPCAPASAARTSMAVPKSPRSPRAVPATASAEAEAASSPADAHRQSNAGAEADAAEPCHERLLLAPHAPSASAAVANVPAASGSDAGPELTVPGWGLRHWQPEGWTPTQWGRDGEWLEPFDAKSASETLKALYRHYKREGTTNAHLSGVAQLLGAGYPRASCVDMSQVDESAATCGLHALAARASPLSGQPSRLSQPRRADARASLSRRAGRSETPALEGVPACGHVACAVAAPACIVAALNATLSWYIKGRGADRFRAENTRRAITRIEEATAPISAETDLGDLGLGVPPAQFQFSASVASIGAGACQASGGRQAPPTQAAVSESGGCNSSAYIVAQARCSWKERAQDQGHHRQRRDPCRAPAGHEFRRGRHRPLQCDVGFRPERQERRLGGAGAAHCGRRARTPGHHGRPDAPRALRRATRRGLPAAHPARGARLCWRPGEQHGGAHTQACACGCERCRHGCVASPPTLTRSKLKARGRAAAWPRRACAQEVHRIEGIVAEATARQIGRLEGCSGAAARAGLHARALGSFCRGSATSGDIDMMIVPGDAFARLCSQALLIAILEDLKGAGVITDDIAVPTHDAKCPCNGRRRSATWLGACYVPGARARSCGAVCDEAEVALRDSSGGWAPQSRVAGRSGSMAEGEYRDRRVRA